MAEQIENSTSTQQVKRGFFRRTRVYLLEYVIYHCFLIVLLGYIAYTFYALFWAISGGSFSADLVEANIWFLAGSFVFVPLTLIAYTRTRWEEVTYPARLKQGLRVAITYIQLIFGIISGITFALIALINLFRFVVGTTDASTLLTHAIPSAIMTAVMVFVTFDILTHQARRSLKLFRPVFFAVCLIASIILLIMTAYYGRTGRHDLQTMKDLKAISLAINDSYDYQQSAVETDLAKLNLDSGILSRAEERNYQIKNVESYNDSSYRSSRSYQLCADFQHEVSSGRSYSSYYSSLDIDSNHGSGNYCFSLYAY